MISRTFLFAVLLLGLVSCNNDLKVAAPWKEVTTIWGLLNINDTTHYIRITKGFLDPNNPAAVSAKVEDSLYYKNLNAFVEEMTYSAGAWKPNGIKYTLAEERGIPKDPGFFGNAYQILYKFDAKLSSSKQYRIVVYTPTGDTVTSQTSILDNIRMTFPSNGQNAFRLSSSSNEFRFTPPLVNATEDKVHEMFVRLHYTEYDPANPTATNKCLYVDYKMYKDMFINRTDGLTNPPFQFNVSGLEMIEVLHQNIKVNSAVQRQLKGIEFVVDMGGKDLATLININQPSSSIVQERPNYTNVRSAKGNPTAGLFSSRTRFPVNLKSSGITTSYYPDVSNGFISSESPAIRHIGFQDSLRARYPELNFAF